LFFPSPAPFPDFSVLVEGLTLLEILDSLEAFQYLKRGTGDCGLSSPGISVLAISVPFVLGFRGLSILFLLS
jgi:hypothetical protein